MICEVRGIPVYYEIFGEGHPILMLHGGGGEYHGMVFLMEPAFAHHPGWKRIYFDMPGHGKTPAPDWLINHDQVLEIILGFIDQVIGKEPFALAGGSRGGYVARGILARRSLDVSGILLIIPAHGASKFDKPDPVVLAKDEKFMNGLTPGEAAFLGGYVVQDARALEDYYRGLSFANRADPRLMKSLREPQNYAFSFDVDMEPAIFDKPALVLAGRQDSMVGYKDSLKMVEQFPRGTLVVLDRAGHALPVEQEDLFRHLVAEWLRRVEEMPWNKVAS